MDAQPQPEMQPEKVPRTPSQRIIKAFGGIRATARRFDKPPTTVQHWHDTAIPQRYQQMFLDGAREDGLSLGPADFFEMPDAADEAGPT